MPKHFARRQVRDAVRSHNGHDVSDIHTTPTGSHVLVYRPKADRREDLFTVLNIVGENITALLPLPLEPTKLRSIVVRRFVNHIVPDQPLHPSTQAVSEATIDIFKPLDRPQMHFFLPLQWNLQHYSQRCHQPTQSLFAWLPSLTAPPENTDNIEFFYNPILNRIRLMLFVVQRPEQSSSTSLPNEACFRSFSQPTKVITVFLVLVSSILSTTRMQHTRLRKVALSSRNLITSNMVCSLMSLLSSHHPCVFYYAFAQ